MIMKKKHLKYQKPKIRVKKLKSLFLDMEEYPLNYLDSVLAYCDYTYGNCYQTTSDKRLKKDIKPITSPLDSLEGLRGVKFKWNTKFPEYSANKRKVQLGLLAQDVEKIYPDLVKTDENGIKSVQYHQFTAIFIEAFKELNRQNRCLQQRLDKLERKLR